MYAIIVYVYLRVPTEYRVRGFAKPIDVNQSSLWNRIITLDWCRTLASARRCIFDFGPSSVTLGLRQHGDSILDRDFKYRERFKFERPRESFQRRVS